VHREVSPTLRLAAAITQLVGQYGPRHVLLGDGTWSRKLRPVVEEALTGAGCDVGVRLVNEKHTTERARADYWLTNPPRGLWRLVPLGLQVPREPYDDYAAAVMARDFLESLRQSDAVQGSGVEDQGSG